MTVTPLADTGAGTVPSDTEKVMSLYVTGSWSGWDGDTIVKLTDGSVWEQAEYHYEYRYAYRPTARIEGDVMFVDGMTRGVRVRRLR